MRPTDQQLCRSSASVRPKSVSSLFPPKSNPSWVACRPSRQGSFLSGALVIVGLRRHLKTHSIDGATLFAGRQSITRVAFELLRQFGWLVFRLLFHIPLPCRKVQTRKPTFLSLNPQPSELALNWIRRLTNLLKCDIHAEPLQRRQKIMAKNDISVIVCTHNPRADYLLPGARRAQLAESVERAMGVTAY